MTPRGLTMPTRPSRKGPSLLQWATQQRSTTICMSIKQQQGAARKLPYRLGFGTTLTGCYPLKPTAAVSNRTPRMEIKPSMKVVFADTLVRVQTPLSRWSMGLSSPACQSRLTGWPTRSSPSLSQTWALNTIQSILTGTGNRRSTTLTCSRTRKAQEPSQPSRIRTTLSRKS